MEILSSLFTVERAIPDSVLAGLATREYTLHGGVVRNAGGQIVRYLVPAASKSLDPFGLLAVPGQFVNTWQLHNLTKMTEQVLAISQTTMALSGLNLAVSAVGFSMLYKSLRDMDARLKTMDAKLDWIKTFLDSERRSVLLHAADELAALPGDPEHRKQILHASRDSVGTVAMHYLQHWDESASIAEAMAYQHYYCMGFLLKARCSAELGMYENSVKEIEVGYENWRERSRNLANTAILKDDPDRFLEQEYLDSVPTTKLVSWMEFATDDELGFEWIDKLRHMAAERSAGSWWPPFGGGTRGKSSSNLVGVMDNLVARNNVLEGYVSQYQFLEQKEITPSILDLELSSISRDYVLLPSEGRADEEGLLVLAPKS